MSKNGPSDDISIDKVDETEDEYLVLPVKEPGTYQNQS